MKINLPNSRSGFAPILFTAIATFLITLLLLGSTGALAVTPAGVVNKAVEVKRETLDKTVRAFWLLVIPQGHEWGTDADMLDGLHAASFALKNEFSSFQAETAKKIADLTNTVGTIDFSPYLRRTEQASDSARLGGQLPSFFQEAGNIISGTLSDARLSTNVALLNLSQTFTALKTFAGGLTVSGGTLSLPTGSITSTFILDSTITAADLASNITISTTGNISTTSGGTITSAGLLTVSSGISSGGNITFSTDNTYDIGASAATRPRNIYIGSNLFMNSSTDGRIKFGSQAAGIIESGTTSLTLAKSDGTNAIARFYSAGGLHVGTGDSDPGVGNLRADGFIDVGTTPATAGTIRLPNNQLIKFRNAANTADIAGGIYANTSDEYVIRDDGVGNPTLAVGSQYIKVGRDVDVVASAGTIRMPSTGTGSILARNAANTGNYGIGFAAGAGDRICFIRSSDAGCESWIQPNGATQLRLDGSGGVNILLGQSDGTAAFMSIGGNVATVGNIRLPNNTSIYARNAANTANVQLIGVDTSNRILLGQAITSAETLMDIGGPGTGFAVCHSIDATATNDVGIVDCTSAPGADYAEMYPVSAEAEFGDVVVTGNELVNTYDSVNGQVDWNKVLGKVTRLVKSTKGYQGNLIGVVSNNDGDFTSAGHNIKAEDNPKPVSLNGRVLVKVSTENGAIAAGDPITSSSTPGVGMRATKAGRIVGLALEPFSCSDKGSPCQGKIMVFINPSWYDPQTVISDQGSVNSGGETLAVKDGQLVVTKIQAEEGIFGTITSTISAVFEKLTAKTAEIVSATISNLTATKAQIKDLEVLNKIQLRDQATGEVYCTWIENGEWQKTKSECPR